MLCALLYETCWRRFTNSIAEPSQQSSIVRRRERDLNSRVQGTVDFESTAIPGYAISAVDGVLMRAGHKRDATASIHADSNPQQWREDRIRIRRSLFD